MVNQVTIEILTTAPSTWTDITTDVYLRDPVTISRGRSPEQTQAEPQRLSFTLDNRNGKYSPRNPLSPLFGKIGRNTPVRCTIDSGAFTRFYGEISGLAPRWNEPHTDNYIQVEAYGILRRLGQGQPAVSNGLRDWVLGQSTLAAYYPLSGGEETIYSQNIAPGKTGSFHGLFGPIFTYGKDMGAAWLGSGMELNSTGANPCMEGDVDANASNVALDFVFQSPAFGVLDVEMWPSMDSIFTLQLNTSGDAGTAQVSYYDGHATILTDTATAAIPALQDTELHTCRFLLQTVAGPNIQWSAYIDGQLITSNTFGLGFGLSWLPMFRFHYDRYVNQTVMNMAHLAVWADNTLANIPSAFDYTGAAFAYAGETADARIDRICFYGDIPMSVDGASGGPMGPQFTESRLEQLRDVEATDMGILAEQRDAVGLQYRLRNTLYNQSAAFILSYANGQVMAPLEPVDDDQFIRNDVTATRREGGSVRYTVDTGPLSTQDPPSGVGRYETEVTVNVESDDLLDAVAGWVLNVGSLNKARWPSVTVNLNSPNFPAGLKTDIKFADIGDLFVITGMSKAFVYDDVSLIIVGYTETITPFEHRITFNCMPADPYEVFVVESTGFRLSSGDTSLVNASMTTTSTSMSVLSSSSVLWTTTGGDLPISLMVNGEEMTVTAISGTTPGSAQTFTVTRAVNGVVKTHSAGEIVRLKRESVLAL